MLTTLLLDVGNLIIEILCVLWLHNFTIQRSCMASR